MLHRAPRMIVLLLLPCIGLLLLGAVAFYTHKSEATPAASVASKTKPQPKNDLPDIQDKKQWEKIFDDEFNGSSLDAKKWSTCYEWYDRTNGGCTNNGNDELEWYQSDQVSLQSGHVTLKAEAVPVTVTTSGKQKTYPYRSGMISTGRATLNSAVKFDAKYGYYEARIKMEGGQGVWPAFWLLPTDKIWPPEIDIMEFLGHTSNEVLLTYHWGDSPTAHQEDSTSVKGSDFTDGWHTYSVNWQPGKIEWFIDGKLQKTSAASTVPAKRMQIIVNLAVGGKLPGNPDASTTFPRTMQVDYVRAYGKVL